jgi:hypothetical protein
MCWVPRVCVLAYPCLLCVPNNPQPQLPGIPHRIHHPRLLKPRQPQQTRITMPAALPLNRRVIARMRQPIRHPQRQPLANNLRLRHPHQRRMNMKRLPTRRIHPRPRRQIRQLLKRRHKLRPAIRISRIIHRVHPQKNIKRLRRLRKRQRKTQKHRVPCRHIRDRYRRLPRRQRHPPNARRSIFIVTCRRTA